MKNGGDAEDAQLRRIIRRVEETNRSINAGIANQQRIDMLEKLELRLGDDQKGQVWRRLLCPVTVGSYRSISYSVAVTTPIPAAVVAVVPFVAITVLRSLLLALSSMMVDL